MNFDEILTTPRREIDPNTIQLPESEEVVNGQTNENNGQTQENAQANAVTMSLGELANMAIGVYNALQTAIYKRVEPNFDAALTPEEIKALQPPVKAVLQQYNVTMSPMSALITTSVGINLGKIMQIKMMRAEMARIEAEKAEEEKKQKNIETKNETKEFAV